jgi:solute carrier family 50 protein (sugar transporter)
MPSTAIITNVICPTVGMTIGNLMWLSPLPAVLEVRLTRNIGSLNPYPFVLMIFNCIGWLIYAALTKDFFIFFSNVFGLGLGLYYSIVCLTVTSKKTVDSEFSDLYIKLESLVIFALFFWSTIGVVAGTAFSSFSDERHEAALLVGYLCCAFAIGYYSAPCATMVGSFYLFKFFLVISPLNLCRLKCSVQRTLPLSTFQCLS